MADAVEVAIPEALVNRLNALVLIPPVPVAQEFVVPVTAVPPAGPGVYYLQTSFLPATSFATAIDDGAYNQHYGIFQIDLRGPLGEGNYKSRRIAAKVGGWFARGTKCTKDGFTAIVFEPPHIREGRIEGVWLRTQIDIKYKTFARSTTYP
jgi:hypothetical protein